MTSEAMTDDLSDQAYEQLCQWEETLAKDDPFWRIPTTNPAVRCCTEWPECTHVLYWWEKNRDYILRGMDSPPHGLP